MAFSAIYFIFINLLPFPVFMSLPFLKKSPPFPSLLSNNCVLLFPFTSLPALSLFTFLLLPEEFPFCHFSDHIPSTLLFPSGDLELGAIDKKEHATFVFLVLGNLTHYDLFCFSSFPLRFTSVPPCIHAAFPFSPLGWKTFALFPFPRYCEQSENQHG